MTSLPSGTLSRSISTVKLRVSSARRPYLPSKCVSEPALIFASILRLSLSRMAALLPLSSAGALCCTGVPSSYAALYTVSPMSSLSFWKPSVCTARSVRYCAASSAKPLSRACRTMSASISAIWLCVSSGTSASRVVNTSIAARTSSSLALS